MKYFNCLSCKNILLIFGFTYVNNTNSSKVKYNIGRDYIILHQGIIKKCEKKIFSFIGFFLVQLIPLFLFFPQ